MYEFALLVCLLVIHTGHWLMKTDRVSTNRLATFEKKRMVLWLSKLLMVFYYYLSKMGLMGRPNLLIKVQGVIHQIPLNVLNTNLRNRFRYKALYKRSIWFSERDMTSSTAPLFFPFQISSNFLIPFWVPYKFHWIKCLFINEWL